MAGVGTCSTETMLSPVYTAARIRPGAAATTSESSVGKEIPQRLTGAFRSLIQFKQFRKKSCGASHGGGHNLAPAEAAGVVARLRPHSIEIQRKVFVHGIGYDTHGIKRDVILLSPQSDGSRFHFHCVGARLAQMDLFHSRRYDAVDRK
jgi:hypothetical protein